MIYDCFQFYNELELLEIRLHELDSVVDKFILVESTRTHTGLLKPLYFSENKERFSKFLPKIQCVVVDKIPDEPSDVKYSDMCPQGDPWVRERYQRNILKEILKTQAKDDDIIIFTDADEIPSASAVLEYKPEMGLTCFFQKMYFYWLNCYTGIPWTLGKIIGYKQFINTNKTITETRYIEFGFFDHTELINGGWHFCWQGGVDRIIDKIKAWGHSNEYCVPKNIDREWIEKAINTPRDVLCERIEHHPVYMYQHPEDLSFVPLDNTFPKYLLDNQEKFKTWIKSSWGQEQSVPQGLLK